MLAKFDKIKRLVKKGCKRKGLDVLGVMPFIKCLTAPTIRQIKDELKLTLLSKSKDLDRVIGNVIVGAMEPHEALNYMHENSLIITPGDREDIILTAISSQALKTKKKSAEVAGIILSGGIMPHTSIMCLAEKSGIPILLSEKDTYSVASNVHDITIKIRPEDKQKTQIVKNMVSKYVDIKTIAKRIK